MTKKKLIDHHIFYPLNLLISKPVIYPIFPDNMAGLPYIFDFSENNPATLEYETQNFDHFQEQVFAEMKTAKASWGIGKYLEERKNLLAEFPQMIEEKRFYHAGVDVIVPGDCTLFAPLDGKVFLVGVDAGKGNYGGYIVLEHKLEEITFFTLFGHLNTNFPVSAGHNIRAGEAIGKTGSYEDSGGWFTHTHLQVLTARAIAENRLMQGYVALEDVTIIDTLFPNPYFLLSVESLNQ